jgi:acyl-coenzyme A thioesterase PaaI-like protein
MDIANLPFNKVIGLKTEDTHVVLSPQPQHLNHVDTIHAAVIFGIAEAAAGQCLLCRFPDLAQDYGAVLRGATAKYRRPASVAQELRGIGVLDDNVAKSFFDTLQSRGRAILDIPVSVMQGDLEVFTGTFTWFAAAK